MRPVSLSSKTEQGQRSKGCPIFLKCLPYNLVWQAIHPLTAFNPQETKQKNLKSEKQEYFVQSMCLTCVNSESSRAGKDGASCIDPLGLGGLRPTYPQEEGGCGPMTSSFPRPLLIPEANHELQNYIPFLLIMCGRVCLGNYSKDLKSSI